MTPQVKAVQLGLESRFSAWKRCLPGYIAITAGEGMLRGTSPAAVAYKSSVLTSLLVGCQVTCCPGKLAAVCVWGGTAAIDDRLEEAVAILGLLV